MPRIRYFIRLQTQKDRIRVDFETEFGQVTALRVVQYEIFREGNWQPVARYDTAHGYFHRDVYTSRGAVKYRIFIQDLGQALTYAIQDLRVNWEMYKRRYEGG